MDFEAVSLIQLTKHCLTLMLVDPQESLIPDKVASDQSRLADAILKAAKEERSTISEVAEENRTDAGVKPATPSLTTTAVEACEVREKQSAGTRSVDPQIPSRADHRTAITTLSFLTVRLLQAWDGYVRERLTAEGVSGNNLLALLAYEAGRNMAALSWNASVLAVPLENRAQEGADTNQKIADELCQVWKATFTDSNAVQLLHQITALSAVLDDAYYRTNEKPAALSTSDPLDDLLIVPDPRLPSQVLLAVKQSVEYWQRTVLLLSTPASSNGADGQGAPKYHMDVRGWKHLREALIEQCGIRVNLMTGQQDLRGFTVESITPQILDEALSEFRTLAQRDLPAATRQAAQQIGQVVETATASMVEISQKATEVAKEGLERLFNAVHPLHWVIIGVSGVMFVIFLVYVLNSGGSDALVGTATSLVTGVLGFLGIKWGGETKTTT